MTITFVSNYINHHQIPVSNVMYENLGSDYAFVQTEPMEEERVKMGWGLKNGRPPYLLELEKDEEECKRRIAESDVVIFGGTEREDLIEERLKAGKSIIRYSERLYREGQWKAISPRGLIKKYHDHTRYSNSPVCLLCSGAYVADDFEIIRAYRNKRLKWGYFPEFRESSEEERRNKKDGAVLRILWAGRFLKLKHAQDALEAVAVMDREGIPFEMTFIGEGECGEELKAFTQENHLTEKVRFTGFLSPSEVREEMDKADVFLFTSDFKEGWGAVVNEAMNSGCVVIASHAAGAVPFLIKDGVNGRIYKSGDVVSLTDALREVLTNDGLRKAMSKEAYRTIATQWNPKEAGRRLLKLCESMKTGEVVFEKEGPLSAAEVIPEKKMYQYVRGKTNGT